ncbi:MAG: hypothetical protein RL417_1332 [Pseudomonadota bacterium]|jgi:hypothetical protein
MNHTLIRWLVPFALGAAVPVEGEQIFVFKQKDGIPLFTNRAESDTRGGAVLGTARGSFLKLRRRQSSPKLFLDHFREEIVAAAREHNMDSDLVTAVIHAESSFNPRAVSPKGAKGLMQLMPVPAKSLGVKDPFAPRENIRGGTTLLAELHRKFGGDDRLTLAAYNAGETAVRRYNGVPPYRETRAYVEKVLRLREAYSLKRGAA